MNNLSNCFELETQKIQVTSNGIRIHDLCDVGEMLYKRSYKAGQLAAGEFVTPMRSRERTR